MLGSGVGVGGGGGSTAAIDDSTRKLWEDRWLEKKVTDLLWELECDSLCTYSLMPGLGSVYFYPIHSKNLQINI